MICQYIIDNNAIYLIGYKMLPIPLYPLCSLQWEIDQTQWWDFRTPCETLRLQLLSKENGGI